MKKSLNYLEVIVKKSFVHILGLILVKDKKACTKIAKFFKVTHDSVIGIYLQEINKQKNLKN